MPVRITSQPQLLLSHMCAVRAAAHTPSTVLHASGTASCFLLDHAQLRAAFIQEGAAKIGDVGLAKVAGREGVMTHGGFFGTFAWCAPEVLLGERCES